MRSYVKVGLFFLHKEIKVVGIKKREDGNWLQIDSGDVLILFCINSGRELSTDAKSRLLVVIR